MPNVKWSYMDHWVTHSPQGPVSQYLSVKYVDRFIKQIAALGFKGLDTFGFRLSHLASLFGSAKKFEEFIQERGLEKIVSVFQAYPYISKTRAPHVRATHDAIFQDCLDIIKGCQGLTVESFVAMPSSTYWQTEPVTDEKIKIMADLWNRVGKMTMEHGIKTTCHHEFWGAIRTMDQIDKFYRWTDPKYVYYFCDTAQHVIAGTDPVALYLKYHDRCSGFHFKDTHNVDTKGEYRIPPDAELIAPSVQRWFWEMGTPEGLVDFPALMNAIKDYQYTGWLTVEHDKADIGGGNYAESTCISKWYIDNVLSKIYE
ncbi:MAG: sugar phosphate isomerase/epimerase [Acidobacteria bacterium]|nr:sugar phosphate isomerase/epimerase [Acidobacteriota bacterium]